MAGELKLADIQPATGTKIVTEGKYIKGGFFVVADTAEMNGLKTAGYQTLVNGSLCFCQADSTFYQYDGDTWEEADLGGSITLNTVSDTDTIPVLVVDTARTDGNSLYLQTRYLKVK